MKVVLDSNIFFDNWYLRGPNVSLLEKHIKLGGSRLFIPEVVLLEVKGLFQRELSQNVKALSKLNALTSGVWKKGIIPIPAVEETVKKYEKVLARRIKQLRAQIPTHADIPQKNVASRALSHRRPFKESDKGYKDTLIWETILRKIADRKQRTFFITKNFKDFSSERDKNRLHEHLVEDLTTNKLPQDCVSLFPDLKSFVDDAIVPHLKKITDEAIQQLEKIGEYKSFSIKRWFIENRDEIIKSANTQADSLSFDSDLEDPEVYYIEDPDKIIVEDIRLADNDLLYIDMTIIADVVIEVFIFRTSYSWLADEYPLEILDSNWSDHYMWGQMVLKLPMSLSLTFDLISAKALEFEVNSFSSVYGLCRHCWAPILSDAAETCSECGKSLFPE